MRLRAARLTPRQMQCLSLYYYDGLNQEQIGSHLGIGQRAVSQHLAYGLRKLVASRLEVRRVTMDAPARLTHMDTETLDQLSPEITRAIW